MTLNASRPMTWRKGKGSHNKQNYLRTMPTMRTPPYTHHHTHTTIHTPCPPCEHHHTHTTIRTPPYTPPYAHHHTHTTICTHHTHHTICTHHKNSDNISRLMRCFMHMANPSTIAMGTRFLTRHTTSSKPVWLVCKQTNSQISTD